MFPPWPSTTLMLFRSVTMGDTADQANEAACFRENFARSKPASCDCRCGAGDPEAEAPPRKERCPGKVVTFLLANPTFAVGRAIADSGAWFVAELAAVNIS
jgi:hypothetical protein